MGEALIYVDDDLPGITRQKKGKGWCYFDPDGKRITDKDQIERLNAIAFPPAYEDAWFSPASNGHILATGYDEKGRKQYRYHPDFRAQREGEKFEACRTFGHKLPLLRARLDEDLSGRKLDKDRVVAAMVRLLDLTSIRVGNEQYAERNKSYGATTLRRRHAKRTGRKLTLSFKAKSNKHREVAITDRKLLAIVKKMEDLPGQHLFQYIDDDGEPHAVQSCHVNDYIRDSMGESFSAKHFRTWSASAHAFELLADGEGDMTLKSVMDEVAADLGNTPTIARNSYVHPAVVALIKDGQEEWREKLELPRKTKYLTRHERGLIDFLDGWTAADMVPED
ncbi:DNA topoisomerase IB [Novosphingopyxis sp. YJ-S2-01]|uniref:DNA topoisomerase IB n=1 Tax=Novosphingopyxis sp. YJ-S2-01 TaxID=2794021 RepID=UPI0018DD3879|nr:DNA topoisomerase IB [Novosphingopyxis sp. YJ-S2-01]MBH9536406.1 DNA topoisomerase IB [Novosphingopyxis sp. YJ-S2-01]